MGTRRAQERPKSPPKPFFNDFGGRFWHRFLTFVLQVRSSSFCRRPIQNRYFYSPGRPQKGTKNVAKKDPLPNASEDRLEHEKTSKTDPKSVPKIVKFWVPFFLAALGANLGLSCALLARMGAHLASFQHHLGPTWTILGPTWASLAPSWPSWCSSCTIWRPT